MIIERITTYTPLGIRFWDPVFNSQVSEGLEVKTWPASRPDREVNAFLTVSGIYAFQNLPGMRDIEFPPGDEVDLAFVVPRRFVVDVCDNNGRFLPVRFSVWLPILDYTGVYRPGYPSSLPDSAEPRFYLFSAPARSASFGIASVRANVVEAGTVEPAVYAFIEAEVAGEKYYSYTDQRGAFVLLFPYPPVENTGGSPPGISMNDQSWPLTLRISYQSKSRQEREEIWEFSQIKAQPPALTHRTTTETSAELFQTLRYGQELNLITTGPEARSTLWIQPS